RNLCAHVLAASAARTQSRCAIVLAGTPLSRCVAGAGTGTSVAAILGVAALQRTGQRNYEAWLAFGFVAPGGARLGFARESPRLGHANGAPEVRRRSAWFGSGCRDRVVQSL